MYKVHGCSVSEIETGRRVDYEFAFTGGTLTPRISFSHTDENYSSLIQTPYYLNDARNLTNFSITYDREDWTVQAYVNNLSDDVYIVTAREHMVGYGDPRLWSPCLHELLTAKLCSRKFAS